MRLIDVDDALERLKKAEQEMKVVSIVGCKAVPMDGVIEFLEKRPTVDAVKVVHGHWCWEGKFKACSECGSYIEWDEILGANFWKFCPYCGAKMDGGSQ